MKKTKKSFKSSILGGYKGVVVLQKNNSSRRKALVSNVVAARAALRLQKEKTSDENSISTLTPQSVVSNNNSRTLTSSLSSKRSQYRTKGSSFDKFMDDRKDWRSFGSLDDDFDTWMGILDYYYKNGRIT